MAADRVHTESTSHRNRIIYLRGVLLGPLSCVLGSPARYWWHPHFKGAGKWFHNKQTDGRMGRTSRAAYQHHLDGHGSTPDRAGESLIWGPSPAKLCSHNPRDRLVYGLNFDCRAVLGRASKNLVWKSEADGSNTASHRQNQVRNEISLRT